MKVLHVSPLFFGADGVVGGGERYALELALAMAQHTPTRLFSFARRPRRERRGALDIVVARPRHYLGGKNVNPLSAAFLPHLFWADVIHCHQVHTVLTDLCVLVGRALGKPVFLTDHAGAGKNYAHRLHTVGRATGLLLVSQHNASGYGRWSAKTTIIYGGIDHRRFMPREAVRARRALYVGRIIPYKGIHHLIEGTRPTTDVRIVGAVYHDQYGEHLRRLAAGRAVTFVPAQPHAALPDEYRAAAVSVLPSVEVDLYGKRYPKSEILGLVLLEAMACATPVVCSAIGGMPELVVDGETGVLVPPGASAALGEQVERILDDPALAARLGQQARAHVLARFTWDRVARVCLDTYASRPPGHSRASGNPSPPAAADGHKGASSDGP